MMFHAMYITSDTDSGLNKIYLLYVFILKNMFTEELIIYSEPMA